MTNARHSNARGLASIVAVAAALVVMMQTTPSHAEEPGMSATGKGITGGALLGGEVVMALEAAFGVQSTWAYVGGGIGGAAAGGLGGYYVEDDANAKPAYYLLAGGMALIIPTTVAVLQATSYKAPEEYSEDQMPPNTQPSAEPPSSGVGPSARSGKGNRKIARAERIPSTLLHLQRAHLQVGVPAVAVAPTYSLREVKTFGVQQRSEVRVPVFGATF